MGGPRDLKFYPETQLFKIFDTCSRVFGNSDQGPNVVLKTIFPIMAITLEWEDLGT